MNTSLLKEAGLSEGETKVYLALAETGVSTAGPVQKKAGVAKSIIYQILERLIQKGLASCIIKEKTKYFQASQPAQIINYLNEKESSLKETIKKVNEELIPELLLKQKLAKKSEALIYFGLKGIRTAHENIYSRLKTGEEYYYLGIPEFQPEEQHAYWRKDQLRRVKAGIRCKSLYNKGTDPKILKNRNSYKGCEARYMPVGIKTPATFLIYAGVTVIILQSPSAIAVEIINKEIADSFKAYFDEFWKNSSKSPKVL